MSKLIKIGIDPSGSGTTAIVVFKNDILISKLEYNNKFWINHAQFILQTIKTKYIFDECILNVENCLPTNVPGTKDKDDLLRLLGAIEKEYYGIINWICPKHTKSVVNKIEYKSKFLKNNPHLNDNFGDIKVGWGKDARLYYEYGKGWKYNNEKISHHIRDAIIIANYNKG